MYLKLFSTFVLFLGINACTSDKKKEKLNEPETKKMIQENDPHSFARPEQAIVKHLKWNAKVDFDKKLIEATAIYDIENRQGVDSIYLDSKDLNVEEIKRNDTTGPLAYRSEPFNNYLGTKLSIPITAETKQISIKYSTSEGADALQFLAPQQTAGKKHPFLFTQSQAILARSWIPCQDSPGIRFTYEASVQVPKGMMALMSAGNPKTIDEDGIYEFEMKQAIPSYLMALAVGFLEYKSMGRNTGVYAEPEMIEAAAFEFSDMQAMLDTAEALYGPYRWEQYDVIVLPPSFPFGGMENPRLTFATPTIIAGDKSLTALIAHELAHSWSGNLVTNANWEDIWLNEGFTVYFENRIMEEIYGKDFANMLALLSHQDLKEEITHLTEADRLADTRLKVDLKGRNPDDGLTGIPYDKGYFLLRLIEETVGRARWDQFLMDYFNKYAFEVMTTDKFLDEINQSLFSENPKWKNEIGIEKWIFEPGLPENCPVVISDKFKKVEEEIAAWLGGKSPKDLATSKWMTPEWMHFVRQLPDELSEKQLSDLDSHFKFTTIGNSEIQAAWFEKVIPNNYKAANEATEAFLIRVGRRKFLTPIYKAILKSADGKATALAIYEKARPNYHAVSRQSIDQLLEYN